MFAFLVYSSNLLSNIAENEQFASPQLAPPPNYITHIWDISCSNFVFNAFKLVNYCAKSLENRSR